MKSVKSILVLLVLVAFSFTAKADNDQVITYNQFTLGKLYTWSSSTMAIALPMF